MLNMECSIYRKTENTSSTTYGPNDSIAESVSHVPCTVQIATSREIDFAARETGVLYAFGYFEYGTDIRSADRIYMIGGQYDGYYFSVTGTPDDTAGRQAFIRVPLEYRAGGGLR